MIVTLSDVTAVRELTARLEQLSAVAECMRDAVVIMTTAGDINWVNPAFTRLFGYASDEAVGQLGASLIGTLFRDPALLEAIRQSLQHGETYRGQHLHATRDGRELWCDITIDPVLDDTGTVTQAFAVLEDITAERSAHAALVAAEQRFRRLVEASRDIVIRAEPGRGFTYVSPRVTEVLGWTSEELIGTDPRDLLHPDDATDMQEQRQRALDARHDFPMFPAYRHRHKDGHYVWIEARPGAVYDRDGTLLEVISTWRDDTGRRELETRLREADRLKTVGTLAGGLAHDFNNMLAVVQGTVESMRDSGGDHGTLQADLDTILSVTERARALTRQMLTFAREQVIVPTPQSVNAALEAAVELARRMLPAPQRLRYLPPAADARVQVDRDALATALLNIVANARDAMPPEGVVEIRARLVDMSDTGIVPPGRWVRIDVTDTGVGMSKDVLARAIDPFFTTKAVGKGTGLGLSTVHGAMQAMGGALTLVSTPHVGTTATLWLRVVDDAAEDSATTRAADGGAAVDPPAAGQAVLVVDDEERVRTAVTRLLARRGFTVLAASCGAEAITLIERDPGAIDVLLTDYAMPEMTGQTLADTVRKRWPAIGIVLMSGYTADESTRAWLSEGRIKFLAKPFLIGQLESVILESVVRR